MRLRSHDLANATGDTKSWYLVVCSKNNVFVGTMSSYVFLSHLRRSLVSQLRVVVDHPHCQFILQANLDQNLGSPSLIEVSSHALILETFLFQQHPCSAISAAPILGIAQHSLPHVCKSRLAQDFAKHVSTMHIPCNPSASDVQLANTRLVVTFLASLPLHLGIHRSRRQSRMAGRCKPLELKKARDACAAAVSFVSIRRPYRDGARHVAS